MKQPYADHPIFRTPGVLRACPAGVVLKAKHDVARGDVDASHPFR